MWVNLHMITDTYLHDPPPFKGPFFMPPPFSAVSKSCDPPSVSTTPSPLLISDKSLKGGNTHCHLKFCWKRLVFMGVSDGDGDKETIVGS